MSFNIFKIAHYLYSKRTKAELSLEPAIASLGEPYRAQMLFPGLQHIADFCLPRRNLIIEVDGSSHENIVQQYKDCVNTLALKRIGWDVVRCSNEAAISKPYQTLDFLLTSHRPTLEELEAKLQALFPHGAPVKPKPTKRKRVLRQRDGSPRNARKAKG